MGEVHHGTMLDLTEPKQDPIKEFAAALAERYGKIAPPETGGPSGSGPIPALRADLEVYGARIQEAYRIFRDATDEEISLSYNSEWLLDNISIVRQALREIRHDLPARFYHQLPALAKGAASTRPPAGAQSSPPGEAGSPATSAPSFPILTPLPGYPRIYALARAALAFEQFKIEPYDLLALLDAFQDHVGLTMGELWAFPIFLRYGLIEALVRALAATLARSRRLPANYVIPGRGDEAPTLTTISSESVGPVTAARGQDNTAVPSAVDSNSVGNCIIGLRQISEMDWKAFFEESSRVEHTLRRDPAGVYPYMDFKTRDAYRKKIEELARGSGQDENSVAQAALELALAASPSPAKGAAPAGEAGAQAPERMGEASDEFLEPAPEAAAPQTAAPQTEAPQTAAPGALKAPALGTDHSGAAEEIGYTGRIPADRMTHIGAYLLAEGRPALEQRIGFVPSRMKAVRRSFRKAAVPVYTGGTIGLALVLLLLVGLLALPRIAYAGTPIQVIVMLLLVIPALTVATSIVNWLVTILVPPDALPKLSFKDGLPEAERSVVAVPALIAAREDVDTLLRHLEMHYLRNPEPGLLFTLLADFTDADSETLPGDEELAAYACAAVEALNDRYAAQGGERRFAFLLRKRNWNPSEGKWMGWERKRGKLHEFNRLLLGSPQGLSFQWMAGNTAALEGARYVITLDADTLLPRGAAAQMAGTLAHPLNRAVFDPVTGEVSAGYTLLQPRIEISPTSANRNWFTRIFAGDVGLDLYTLAVSDVYQDLFGEGVYVGKGIYDVEAFERSTAGHVPENTLLSHDLLEGLMGRAGLVTDITMIEDYPETYFVQVQRNHRWIRGDWQLLPWLLDARRFGVHFSFIDRWKIIDNLRRSLLTPVLLLIFVLGLIVLPNSAGLWAGVLLLTLGVPVLEGLLHGGLQTLGGLAPGAAFRHISWSVMRWLLAVAFLPYEAVLSAEAILVTLYRLLFTRRNLLEWTTAAHTARLFQDKDPIRLAWRRMGLVMLMALALAVWLAFTRPAALIGAAPVLVLWMLSPQISLWVSTAINTSPRPLTPEQAERTRRIARQTWSFFERFVGPEDHWLPPDHYQEQPGGLVAHRTSPTNIGLLFTSTLAAYDLGYIDALALIARLNATVDTLEDLPRFRGHFFNWMDTLTLQPLLPRYVSTVDSGNLAACLVITAQACLAMPQVPIFRWELWQGYLDTLGLLSDTLATWKKLESGHATAVTPPEPAAAASPAADQSGAPGAEPVGAPGAAPKTEHPASPVEQITAIEKLVDDLRAEILAARDNPRGWYALFQHLIGPFWRDVSRRLAGLLAVASTNGGARQGAARLETLRALQETATQLERQQGAVLRTINELAGWIPLLENIPDALYDVQYETELTALRAALPYRPLLSEIRNHAAEARQVIASLRQRLAGGDAGASSAAAAAAPDADPINGVTVYSTPEPAPGVAAPDSDAVTVAEAPGKDAARDQSTAALEETTQINQWLDRLEAALTHSATAAGALLNGYAQCAQRCEKFIQDMDFAFLYDRQRRIFHIGFNVDSGQLDQNYYDLLASEARITSLIAIARGEIPQQHWLHLNRPVTSVDGMRVLLSWSATMFEYLMPALFFKPYPGTLLTESALGAVAMQMEYAKSRGVPWGISESGFYLLDTAQNYQYRAFGVPGLGFKRGLGDDLVIAPYASLMALGFQPQAVFRNLQDLIRRGVLGLYGFYEAIDFTDDRLPPTMSHAIVREYMSHHQGMVLLAMANHFHDDIMARRMHADRRIEAVELLLQEQVPLAAPLQTPSSGSVKGLQRIIPERVDASPWIVPAFTPIPQMHLLSNGTYSVLISNAGGGYSRWKDIDLTRWQADGTLDPWGTWVYLQEREPARGNQPGGWSQPWSAALQPEPEDSSTCQVTFFPHMAAFRRDRSGVISTMEVTVSPEDAVEIRRVHLNNTTSRERHLRLTSYGEVILTQQATDTRHPAFNKMFIESEWLPELNMQLFKRRPRSENETPVFMGHMLLASEPQRLTGAHEAGREQFIGRAGNPQRPVALDAKASSNGNGTAANGAYLSGSSGATLDPIFSIGQEVDLESHASAVVTCITLAAESREALLALAQRYQAWDLIERAFHQADITLQTWMGRHDVSSKNLQAILKILSALIYPFKPMRAPVEVLSTNRLGQTGLWRFGVSGDFPILAVEASDPSELELVREALLAHRFLRMRRFPVDLVILNYQQTNYGAELNGMIYRLVSRMNSEQWLNQRGGVFILYADQMQSDERVLLQSAARVLLRGQRGSLEAQLPGYTLQVPHLPEFVPVTGEGQAAPAAVAEKTGAPQVDPSTWQFYNGFGGFSADGREYLVRVTREQPTPHPWTNVIGYPEFGFLVSETGSQCTWAVNSGENRLTPWSNDPVRDQTGEALYLRDEETAAFWSPTPSPAGADAEYITRHGAGYSIFEHESYGLKQSLTVFASPDDPVKIIRLRLENTASQPRRITASQYVEWVLGINHPASAPYLLPEYDQARGCLLASNPYNAEFAARTAFLAASRPIHGLTADRTEFIGRNGTLRAPIALSRIGLESRISIGEDPCAVLQVHIDLGAAGSDSAEQEIYFLLGQGSDREHSLALVDKYHDPAQVEAAWQATNQFWDGMLGTVQVHTPDPAMDLMLNRWLLYQALSCRIWGRTGFYQSSGAYGFRDQLQDVLGLLPIDPRITRAQILNAARRQFEAGDVLHWWHPPSGRGVRTRISDDLLWLPYVTALYLDATGDTAILDEALPFLSGAELNPGEDEHYGVYTETSETFSLDEHCRRAIARGATRGSRGLPLIGTGDWNDGYNRVGAQGKGESVWLGWFLVDVLRRYATVVDQRGAGDLAAKYRDEADAYAAAIEQSAWDGEWYRRAYYDSGAPLGSQQNAECKIDAIAQSWAVISGAGHGGRARQAMQSVLDQLVRPQDRLALLFTPPFDKTARDPGYIKGYLPGIRENGGQYTHGAIWTAWAFARLGSGDQASALFNLFNPIYQSDTAEKVATYRVEPYVICADIYSVEPYVRRGGWTWYTGSAAWMYRLGLEAILGLDVEGQHLRINPVIPAAWDGFRLDYRRGKTIYHIAVEQRPGAQAQVTLDGAVVNDGAIPLTDDGQEHQVVIVKEKS